MASLLSSKKSAIMDADVRRSMGTIRYVGLPQRSGAGNQGRADEGQRGRPFEKAAPATSRSSSIGTSKVPVLSATRSKGPPLNRASSVGTRTPLIQTFRSAASNLSCGKSRKYLSSGGHEAVTPSREAQKSVMKETRPISDKAWQAEQVQAIICFCSEHGHGLTSRDFPLSSSNFCRVFETLIRYLVPEYTVPRVQDLGGELPALLKKIGYPGVVSKSMFQTLGTQHSWPQTLAILSYLLMRAKSFMVEDDILDEYAFSINHDDKKPEEERITFNYMMTCFLAYQQEGKDTFEEETEAFHRQLVDLYQADEKRLAQAQAKQHLVMKEYDKLISSNGNNVEGLKRRLAEKKEDLLKMQQYAEQTELRKQAKEQELRNAQKRVTDLEAWREVTKGRVADLEAECLEKNINSSVACSMKLALSELERSILSKKDDLKLVDDLIWKSEQDLSKRLQSIDDLCKKFNARLMGLDLDNQAELTLDRSRQVAENRAKLQALLEESKQRECKLREDLHELDTQLALIRDQANRADVQVQNVTRELKKKSAEFDAVMEIHLVEEQQLVYQLDDVNEELMNMTQNKLERPDLHRLERELERSREELQEVVRLREQRQQEGIRLLRLAREKVSHEASRSEAELRERLRVLGALTQDRAAHLRRQEADVANTVKQLQRSAAAAFCPEDEDC